MIEDNYVKIFDTTLRDGEQSPGATMNIKEKIEIARQLEQLNVDIIEAGFPAASLGDFEAVRQVSLAVRGPVICALARCLPADIKTAGEALKDAEKKRIHVFVATSAIHRKFKFNKAQDEILQIAVDGVKLARLLVEDVEFSPEDASRTELPFLAEVTEAVIAAGATTVNIPDTVGYTTPSEFAEVITYLKENVPNIDQATLSVHCHDDLGMAVANSLSAAMSGARQIECTLNGIGERAGNCSMEEVVMALKTRNKYFHLDTGIKTTEICKTSRMVSNIAGMIVQPNKAIVGANAFAHEAGIHQDGMLKNRETYEIMDPKDVGWGESELVLGKHSGCHAFETRLLEMGYHLDKEALELAFKKFKTICDKKKDIYDQDLAAIAKNVALNMTDFYVLQDIRMNYHFLAQDDQSLPKAMVIVKDSRVGTRLTGESQGYGPVDSIFKAIQQALGMDVNVLNYMVRSMTRGQDALGEVTVKMNYQEYRRPFVGRAASTDILEASATAFLQAINHICQRG